MKQNKLLMLVIIFLIILIIAGCYADKGNSDGNKTEKLIRLSDDEIIVMYEDNLKPYSYTDGTEAKGINVDLTREAYKIAGIKVKFATAPWKKVLQIVEDGEADAICALYKNPARELKYLFSGDYLSKEVVVFVVRKESLITFDGDFSQLSQYTIACIKGYPPFVNDERVFKKLKINELDSNAQALEKMLNGKVDIVVGDKITLMYILKDMGKLEEVKFLDTPVKLDRVYGAYTKKKDMTTLAVRIDEALALMRANGTEQKIIGRYIN